MPLSKRSGALRSTENRGLFDGWVRGADRAAFMAILIMTARLNDIDLQAWLADVLARIADTPITRLEHLLPWKWIPQTVEAQAT
jgi:transposase